MLRRRSVVQRKQAKQNSENTEQLNAGRTCATRSNFRMYPQISRMEAHLCNLRNLWIKFKLFGGSGTPRKMPV